MLLSTQPRHCADRRALIYVVPFTVVPPLQGHKDPVSLLWSLAWDLTLVPEISLHASVSLASAVPSGSPFPSRHFLVILPAEKSKLGSWAKYTFRWLLRKSDLLMITLCRGRRDGFKERKKNGLRALRGPGL